MRISVPESVSAEKNGAGAVYVTLEGRWAEGGESYLHTRDCVCVCMYMYMYMYIYVYIHTCFVYYVK